MNNELLTPIESLKIIEQHCESSNVFYKYEAIFSVEDEGACSTIVAPACIKEMISKAWILAELCFRAFALSNGFKSFRFRQVSKCDAEGNEIIDDIKCIGCGSLFDGCFKFCPRCGRKVLKVE